MSNLRTNANYRGDRGSSRGNGRGGGFRGGRGGNNRDRGRPREIVFDPEAREQYLTGFHKRNVERKEKAIERAKETERLERLAERRSLRERRKQELEERVEFANQLFKDQKLGYDASDSSENEELDDEEEWHGIPDQTNTVTTVKTETQIKPILKAGDKSGYVQRYQKEGLGEDDLLTGETTVFIQNYDLQEPEIEHKPPAAENPRAEAVLRQSLVRAAFYADRVKKINSGRPVPPKKPKKFRYLTPAERKVNAKKERSRNKNKPK